MMKLTNTEKATIKDMINYMRGFGVGVTRVEPLENGNFKITTSKKFKNGKY